LAAFFQQFSGELKMREAEFFTYSGSFLNLAPAAVAPLVLQFDASSNFVWYYAAFSAYNHAANTGWTNSSFLVPAISILMTPSDTSSQLMNQAMPISHIFGQQGTPFVLPVPRRFPARSVLTFSIVNLDTTITYDLYLSLIGRKEFLPASA
jgi:hypothetical protein